MPEISRFKASMVSRPAIALAFITSFQPFYTFANNVESSGALTVTGLSANEDKVGSETIAVLDLDVEAQLNKGRFHLYIEGTSSSKPGKITDVYGESYADAGAAADKNGDGRVQLSSAEYYLPVGEGELVMGLLYPSGFTESADWTNDETTQFISSSFVNIPTSGAPDYAFGVGYIRPLDGNFTFSLLASQAQGLGDLDGQYSELFNEFDDYFFSAELAWQKDNLSVHVATWMSTLDDDTFIGQQQDNNKGVNVSVGYETDIGRVVLRYGVANEDVSEAASFWGVSWQQQVGDFTYGIGTSKTLVSDDLKLNEAVEDLNQSEIYVKYQVIESMHVTWSMQKIDHSGFTLEADSDIEPSPAIMAARLSYEF